MYSLEFSPEAKTSPWMKLAMAYSMKGEQDQEPWMPTIQHIFERGDISEVKKD